MKTFKVDENHTNKRIDRVIKALFPHMPLSAIYKNLRTKKITLNGKKVKENKIVNTGDEIFIFIKDNLGSQNSLENHKNQKIKKMEFYQKSLKVLYEDDDILALDKPVGALVHTGTNYEDAITMTDIACAYVDSSKFSPTPIHRLDKNTSGVLVFAKNNLALQNLNEQIRKRSVIKNYYALVSGIIKEKKGKIDLALKRVDNKINKVIASEDKDAKKSITHYEVKEYLDDKTLVWINLETGRTHQIRAHFNAIGHPLVGDRQYDKNALGKMLLHATEFRCIQPKTGKEIVIKSPL